MGDRKAHIQLVQLGTMFRDPEQGLKLVGDKVVEVTITSNILLGIKRKLIKEVEAPKEVESSETEPKAEVGSTDPLAAKTDVKAVDAKATDSKLEPANVQEPKK